MSSEDDQCAICWDNFRTPKLLPCKHTFCKKCIMVHGRRHSEYFNCPLCRTALALPGTGVGGFLDNYFADDTIPENVCDECWVEDDVDDCDDCNKSLCIYCRHSHKCRERFHGGKRSPCLRWDPILLDFDFSRLSDSLSDRSSESEVPSDSESEDERIDLPPELHKYGNLTVYKLKLVKTAKENNECDGCVCTLFNICRDKTGAVQFGWNILEQYNMDGLLTGQIPLQNSSDYCGVNGSIVVIEEIGDRIKRITENGKIRVVTEAENFHPLKITSFLDGRVVVVGRSAKHSLAIYVYDKNFDLATSFELPHQFNPQCIAVNAVYDYICVSFLEGSCVQIFDMCGNVVATYSGSPLEYADENQFRPLGICCDREGNVIVVDGEMNKLHLLSSSGSFKGIMEADDDAMGRPYSVTVDASDRIWIGDSENMTIRIFEIDLYQNIFCPSNERNVKVSSEPEAPSTSDLDFLRRSLSDL